MSPETTGLQQRFALDSTILAPGSAAELDLSASTDADVAFALAGDTPFPTRPDGEIRLGHIGLTASGGTPVAVTGGGTTIGFEFSAGVTAGAAIFDAPQQALAALALGETPGLEVAIAPADGSRFALLRAGYKASGKVDGTHPIGGLGTATFGIAAAASGLSAVLHRFPEADGARAVLERTVASWKLPRHVSSATSVSPASWVIAEADGSLAIKLAASLGYDFSFVREAKLAGLSGDIGLKIDASAQAVFGFQVSGRYLVVLGRESDAEQLRLQLFKLSRKGLQAGLNLKIGVTGVETVAPNRVDEFVAAVFGVHGAQIVGVLKHLDRWTSPDKNVGELVAGLVNDQALDILERVTGVDPATAFEAARRKLLDAIAQFESLPERASSELWSILGGLTDGHAAILKRTLELLGSSDEAVQKRALHDLLSTRDFSSSPAGRIVSAIAGRAVLPLLDRLPDVRGTARTVLSILDGGVIARLRAYVSDALDLQKVIDVANETDFQKLDSFLIGRLSAFFDRQLQFSDVDEVREAIHLVLRKRAEVYEKAKKALSSRYRMDLSATWQKTTARTAVLDVVFDTSQAEGRALLGSVLNEADLDTLMVTTSDAVRINSAVLTHELRRKTTLDVTLPRFRFQTESFNSAMARVTADDEGDRVLLYEAAAQDVVSVRRKYQSSLSMSLATTVSPAERARLHDLRVHATDATSWSYQLLHAKRAMRREELEAYTRPFIERYMADQFTGDTTLSVWYHELDRTVEDMLANGPEEFGDVCASFEVSMPADVLSAWMRPHDDAQAAARTMSKAIQKALKEVVPFYYLSDIARLRDLAPSAALLAWAAIPPSADIKLRGNEVILDGGKRVFWDHVHPDTRRRMLRHPLTAEALRSLLPPLRLRLQEARLHGDLQFYQDGEVPMILSRAGADPGDVLLRGLLLFEARIVEKAAEAFTEIQTFLTLSSTSPTRAIDRLAEFAADITTAFNRLAGNTVFGGLSLRAVSQTVFAEASRALDPMLVPTPRAMLALSVLKPESQRGFQIAEFLAGAVPPEQDVLIAQHLVSASD